MQEVRPITTPCTLQSQTHDLFSISLSFSPLLLVAFQSLFHLRSQDSLVVLLATLPLSAQPLSLTPEILLRVSFSTNC